MASSPSPSPRLAFTALAAAFAAICFLVAAPGAVADCPDAGIRCRIPLSDVGSMATENGCSVSSTAGAEAAGDAITGTVSISGTCYNKVQSSDQTSYAYVGDITIGQCYDLFQGGCQPEHCPGNSPGQRCNEQLPQCTVYPQASTQCSNSYTVVSGDSCWQIANSNGLTLEALQGMNSGVNCDNLQPNQQLCLATQFVQGPGTSLCEGLKISG